MPFSCEEILFCFLAAGDAQAHLIIFFFCIGTVYVQLRDRLAVQSVSHLEGGEHTVEPISAPSRTILARRLLDLEGLLFPFVCACGETNP